MTASITSCGRPGRPSSVVNPSWPSASLARLLGRSCPVEGALRATPRSGRGRPRRAIVDLADDHVEAGASADLGDPRAHQPAADDPNSPDVRHLSLSSVLYVPMWLHTLRRHCPPTSNETPVVRPARRNRTAPIGTWSPVGPPAQASGRGSSCRAKQRARRLPSVRLCLRPGAPSGGEPPVHHRRTSLPPGGLQRKDRHVAGAPDPRGPRPQMPPNSRATR